MIGKRRKTTGCLGKQKKKINKIAYCHATESENCNEEILWNVKQSETDNYEA